MGQEISAHNTCNTSRHLNICKKQQEQLQKQPQQPQQHYYEKPYEFYKCEKNYRTQEENYHVAQQQQRFCTYNKESLYSLSSTSNASTTDDEYYKYCQKYNLTKQLYEKSKIVKQVQHQQQQHQQQQQPHNLLRSKVSSTESSTSNSSATSTSTTPTTTTTLDQHPSKLKHIYAIVQKKHQKYLRKSTQNNLGSGNYYTFWPQSAYEEARIETDRDCLSEKSLSNNSCCQLSHFKQHPETSLRRKLNVDIDLGSAVSSASAVSHKSNKSLQQQKHYLDHHLYIKSYLDILEEDEKAKALYPKAKPGGIRNYRPKILTDNTLSASAPSITNSFCNKNSIKSEDPWI